ncbi:MAG: asparagine synthetase B family protein [Luteimonas sp.]
MSSVAIHGLLAKTRSGLERLRADWSALLPATFPAAHTRWWADPDVGLVLHGTHLHAAQDDDAACALAWTGDALAQAGTSAQVLLSRLRHQGADRLREQRGAFALALWDGPRRLLQLVRDPFGQEGLFVRDDGDLIVFCSQLAPLLDDPAFDCRLDLESAHHFLSFGLPGGGRTLARGTTSVPAGHCLEWSPGQPLRTRRYYTPLGFEHRKVVDPQWRGEIIAILDEAIHARSGDGRSAILLSGGVDSSYIAATCAMRHGGEGYDAYTIEFTDGGIENEAPFAALVASQAGIRHHVVPMSITDACAALPQVLAQAKPCSAWAALTHHHLLARIGGDGHTRLLSGLGADEVFGGYSKFLHHYRRLRRQAERWPVAAVDPFDGLLWQPTQARQDLFPGVPRFFDDAAQRAALHAPFDRWSHAPLLSEFYRECRRQKPDAHLFELMVAHECQHRIPDLLLAGFEPIARAAGVGTVYPFLDPQVAAVACALGASERFWRSDNRWKNKKALRRIALERLPDDIIVRPPMSYTTPIRAWMADPRLGGQARERLRASAFWDYGLVRREWLDHLDAQLQQPPQRRATPRPHLEQLWILIVLAAWCDRWAAGRNRPSRAHP